MDFLGPSIAPGVGTVVPGGPNYREAQLVMEMIADSGRMGLLDIVDSIRCRPSQSDRRTGGGPDREPVRQGRADA
ncbi:arginase family protein [Xanthomonas theicola]|uniref:arginase family protein n=1 Tax=Xanthomonas theicola TaxID=56464 RepID=UPI001474951A